MRFLNRVIENTVMHHLYALFSAFFQYISTYFNFLQQPQNPILKEALFLPQNETFSEKRGSISF